jgi:hypothetical protein
MNKVLLGVVGLLVGVALLFGGFFLGQANATDNQAGWMMGSGQRGLDFIGEGNGPAGCDYGAGAAMMGGGMIGNGFNGEACNYGMMGNGFGMMGSGMMGGYGFGGLADVDPLSIEEAETAVNDYLASLGDDNLALGEVMIFDNHAYAQILDKSSDSGAFEVLVDPVSGNVYPEPGPNMMWNTEYGHMGGFGGYGMMGGMMGRGMMNGNMLGNFGFDPNAEISVTGEEAIAIAQKYLDTYLNGTTADETADTFPGYYTIHVLRDGEIIGMLSVNAYTGQVFLHHWHGEFLEMSGEEHG